MWIAAGRAGPVGELLSGLIKLAAAGVKLRQAKGPEAARLGAKACACFGQAQAECGTATLAGLAFARLEGLTREVDRALEPSTSEPVAIVFSASLRAPMGSRPA